MATIDFRIETSVDDMKRLCINLLASIPGATIRGMDKAMKKYLDDAKNKVPKCPYEFGGLQDAHVVMPSRVSGTKTIGELQVRKPFAASLHEGISRHGTPYKNWTTPGSGPKWLESKLLSYGDEYIRIAASELYW